MPCCGFSWRGTWLLLNSWGRSIRRLLKIVWCSHEHETRGDTMANSVRDAMTDDPRSIGASASGVEAARLMREEDIGSLPITDDGKLVGMITDRDITTMVVAEATDPGTTSVGD